MAGRQMTPNPSSLPLRFCVRHSSRCYRFSHDALIIYVNNRLLVKPNLFRTMPSCVSLYKNDCNFQHNRVIKRIYIISEQIFNGINVLWSHTVCLGTILFCPFLFDLY